MAFGDETERLLGQLRSYLAILSDTHTRTMAAGWARAWDDVAPELVAAIADLQTAAADGRITRAQVIRSRRLINALDLIEDRLTGLFGQSASTVLDPLREVVDQAGRTTDRLISSQLPPGERVDGWDRVDPLQVDAIVQRATEQITKRSFPLSSEATATMRRELVRGLVTGTNPRETARRMIARTEGIFNGGLSRALTIARTEQLDAFRAAAQLGEQANVDVLESWIWTATLSARTCPSCWAMNGQEFPIEVPGPIDHQCGRCARVAKPKSWADLGFNIPEPPSLFPDAEARFDGLSVSEQVDILGPSRFAAWKAGEFPISAWTQRRSTPGWRDSMIPTPAPARFKGATRSNLVTAAQ